MSKFTADMFSTRFYSSASSQDRGARPSSANDDDVIDANHIVIDKNDPES
jgi:hypothetical protein